jgi:multicomponent Na+:H+ antiporter subunit B
LKILSICILALFGLLLVFAATELPRRGDADAAVNRDTSAVGSPVVSSYYIRNAEKEMNTPNIVTAILADYRGYDTLGEVIVIFCAGIAVFLILRGEEENAA